MTFLIDVLFAALVVVNLCLASGGRYAWWRSRAW